MPNLPHTSHGPATLAEAVDRVAAELSLAERVKLAAMTESALVQLNSGLGARVRKICGLWQGNPALMAACGAFNPEDTSLAIIRALWAQLRES